MTGVTQVQIRGAANATQQARTLASRELDIDTSNWRLSVHDGSTAGGVEHVTWVDYQNNVFGYAAASGTNTITATYAPAPTAYATGQRFTFKAQNTITGAATLNVNALGAKNIYKKDISSGTLVPLASGEIIQNGLYTVEYDGTQFQLQDIGGGGVVSISQGDLNTLTGSVSVSRAGVGSITSFVTLPGGQYGFCPESSTTIGSGPHSSTGFIDFGESASGATSYGQRARLTFDITQSGGGTSTFLARQRYISSSPPFDMGDGEAAGFVFLLMNADGTIASTYNADVPPWAYNGPTDITACKKCPITGQKYRKVMKKRTMQEVLDGAPIEFEYEPITQRIKNADMKLIPHPFSPTEGQTVVMLDPMDARLKNLLDYQNLGGDIGEFLAKLKPDNEALRRKGPQGVMQVRFTA